MFLKDKAVSVCWIVKYPILNYVFTSVILHFNVLAQAWYLEHKGEALWIQFVGGRGSHAPLINYQYLQTSKLPVKL